MKTVISVEGLSKKYKLGAISSRSLMEDLQNKFWNVRNRLVRRILPGKDQVAIENEEFWALKDVSFEVKEGEVLGIIGKNGAGKSTLLKVLSKVTSPTEGRIRIRGRIASLLEVGTGFHPDLTGRENIFMNGAILGMTKNEIRSKFDEMVDFAGVEKFIDTPVKRYSSGMYVRLAFAVAAHLEPEILIIDEVLAVGDAEFQKKCLGKMKDVAGQGRTVLFVSHDMGAISRLTKTTLLMQNGMVAFQGETALAIQKHLQGNFIKEILDLKPENLFRSNKNYGVRACFTSFHFSKKQFYWKEPPEFNFEIDIKDKSISEIEIGFRISSPAGIPVFTHECKKSFRVSDDHHLFSCSFDQPRLVPGNYIITIGFRSGYETLDALEDFQDFEILEVSENGEHFGYTQGALISGYIDSEAMINMR